MGYNHRWLESDREESPLDRGGLSASNAAKFLDIGRSTLYKLKKSDATFPRPAVIFGRRVYVKQHLLDWLVRQIPQEPSQAAGKPSAKAVRS